MFGQQPQSLKVLASVRGQSSRQPGPDVPLTRARHVTRARAHRSRRQEAAPAPEPEVKQCQPRSEVQAELGGRGCYRGEGPGNF